LFWKIITVKSQKQRTPFHSVLAEYIPKRPVLSRGSIFLERKSLWTKENNINFLWKPTTESVFSTTDCFSLFFLCKCTSSDTKDWECSSIAAILSGVGHFQKSVEASEKFRYRVKHQTSSNSINFLISKTAKRYTKSLSGSK
jgi:hypothetical protein